MHAMASPMPVLPLVFLDDGLSRPELPRSLGRFDDAERQAVAADTDGPFGYRRRRR
jgi:hypothetical protein